MTMPSTSSTADEPLLYRESINVNEQYICWGEQQPHQNDLSFCCDALVPTVSYVEYRARSCLENNVKGLVHAADLECWFMSLYARPPNVLPLPIFLSPHCLGAALATQPTPNFRGYPLVGFNMESIMAMDMKNFKFSVPMPADSTASSYPRYVATPEDWTVLFSLIDSDHTIIISFDGADEWTGIYALLGTQFQTDRQKKNKDAIFKAIHFDAYPMIRNINISTWQYQLAWKIGLIPEKRRLKATMSAMWAFDVSRLTFKFLAALQFFNNLSMSFLQTDILTYATLDTFYPILLFLAFSRYGFVPEAYNAPCCSRRTLWMPPKLTIW
uniref:Uncharacterized protein n=1 Tax=Romanomermis culicivorax TaxID=13658 RepID=A0A915IZW2_ROMCU